MSNRYGPRIVTDGLVLCLDAADRNSYPGSGNTWFDLSGNGYNAINNGATFVNANNGIFSFVTNDYFDLSSLTINSYPGTISAWFKISQNNGYIFSVVGSSTNRYYILYNSSNELCLVRGQVYDPLIIASSLSTDRFYNAVMTYSNNTLYGYLDGEYIDSKSYTNGGWANNARIGSFINGTTFFNGWIAKINIYNRILSSNEVQQNYNATKGRYGL